MNPNYSLYSTNYPGFARMDNSFLSELAYQQCHYYNIGKKLYLISQYDIASIVKTNINYIYIVCC